MNKIISTVTYACNDRMAFMTASLISTNLGSKFQVVSVAWPGIDSTDSPPNHVYDYGKFTSKAKARATLNGLTSSMEQFGYKAVGVQATQATLVADTLREIGLNQCRLPTTPGFFRVEPLTEKRQPITVNPRRLAFC